MKTQSKGLAAVSGASSGIGAVYADCLARRGYDLLLVARSQAPMSHLARKLAIETGRNVQTMAADLTNSKDLAGLERILREDSRIRLLLSNAGLGATQSLLNSDVAKMSRMITLNVEALTRLTYAVAPSRAAFAHGEQEKLTGGQRDENWPDWYATTWLQSRAVRNFLSEWHVRVSHNAQRSRL